MNVKFYVCSIVSTGFMIINTAVHEWKVNNQMFTFLAIISNNFWCTD